MKKMHIIIGILKKLIFITFPAILIALLCAEGISRLTWDHKLGTPGFSLPHTVRGWELAKNYSGHWEGTPAKTNNLGFRDNQDYAIEKGEKTFRIMVLGDSVTFGAGANYKETWPYLFRKKLEKWNPETDWQVWNMGVPGYATPDELNVLEEYGPVYKPDLVIVGFYENDISGLIHAVQPVWITKIKNFLKRNFYLFYHVKHIYHVINSNYVLSSSTPGEWWQKSFLFKPDKKWLKENGKEPFDYSTFKLKHGLPDSPRPPKTKRVYDPEVTGYRGSSGYGEGYPVTMLKPVKQFQKYHKEGTYNVVFFVNIAPDHDRKPKSFIGPVRPHYYDGPHNEMNNWLLKIMGKETPVLSSYEAFWSYRPSEVPGAWGHSFAAANMVKADILFNFISKKSSKRNPLIK
jgi:hypothetical protein